MRYQQLIITEPVANFRALARQGLQSRWGDAFRKGFLYLIVLGLPSTLILALTGWLGVPGDNYSRLMDAYAAFLQGEMTSAEFTQTMAAAQNGSYMIPWLYQLLIWGALTFGITTVYLRYRRRQEAPTELLFMGFSHYGRSFALLLLMLIFISLWTLLFVIPGLIAFYRYRLAFFILADNPDIGPLEAIRLSKWLMRGNKWKLFCLDLSFIGWALLVAVAVIIVSFPLSLLLSLSSMDGFAFGASDYDMGLTIIVAIVASVIAAAFYGLLYMYEGAATAAFYERASGLLKYTDEVQGHIGQD
jgi:uncharacterized membrane protein